MFSLHYLAAQFLNRDNICIHIHFSVWKVTLPSSFIVWFTLSKNAEIEIWRKVHLKISLPMHYRRYLATTSYYVCMYLMNWCSRPIFLNVWDRYTFSFTVAFLSRWRHTVCVIKTELKYDVIHLSQNVLTNVCSVLTQCKSIILTFLLLTNVLSVVVKRAILSTTYRVCIKVVPLWKS